LLNLVEESFDQIAGTVEIWPIAADTNTLISLPLLGAQRTWRDLRLASSRSKMTKGDLARYEIWTAVRCRILSRRRIAFTLAPGE
jgi:hypothetical protein